MDHKLLEITDKLFKEGIEKAEEERRKLIAKAENEAREILDNANQQASEILHQAKIESEEIRNRVNASLKLSADNMLEKLRQDIVGLLDQQVVKLPVKEGLNNTELLQDLIGTIAKNIFANENKQVVITLSPQDESKIRQTVKEKLHQVLQQEPVFLSDESITSGFKIGTSGDNYIISFTDSDFSALVSRFFNEEITALLHAK